MRLTVSHLRTMSYAAARTFSRTSASKFLSAATLTQTQPSFNHAVLTL